MADYPRLADLTALMKDAAEKKKDAETVLDTMRFLSLKVTARTSSDIVAAEHFIEHFPDGVSTPLLRKRLNEFQTKEVYVPSPVAPADTLNPSWAASLVQPPAEPLAAVVRQTAVAYRLDARVVPFSAPVPRSTAAAQFAWVGQGQMKPATRGSYESVRLPPGKIGGLVALTKELVRLTDPTSLANMRDEFVNAAAAVLDQQLIDPTISEVANQRPASITNGLVPIVPSGDLAADVGALLKAFYTAWPQAARPRLVMSPAIAGQLAGTGTQPALTVDGGRADGVPVVTSPGAGSHVVALDAAALLVAGGAVTVDTSGQTLARLDDAPTDATPYVSFFQDGLVGFRIEHTAWWLAAPGSVQLLTVPAAVLLPAGTTAAAPVTTAPAKAKAR